MFRFSSASSTNSRLSTSISAVFSAICCALLFTQLAVAEQLRVKTSEGFIQGAFVEGADGVREYKGIPFAQPPVGDLRWRLPQPPQPRNDVLDATQFSARCSQGQGGGFYGLGAGAISEDCLYLNVWTAATESESLPVMVWIHGGAFVMGSGGENFYSGEHFAQSGVVLVTINYRLGLAGFFAHPALAEEEGQAVANQGIYDQLAALKWVQKNIAEFGGDPDNVTIFGESAGSMSVCYLVATPLAKGLFHKAIGQSGGCFSKHETLDTALEEVGEEGGELKGGGFAVATRLGEALGAETADAEGLAKLRDMSWVQMQAHLRRAGVSPTWRSIYVDDVMFPKQMRELIASGEGNQVPAIVGSNTDEGTTLFSQMPEVPLERWKEDVRGEMGESAERFIELYSSDAEKSTKTAAQQMLSDSIFAWEMRTWARTTEARGEPAYLYVFSYAPLLPGVGRSLGAYHAGEIAYAFKRGGETWGEEDTTLANVIHSFWVNFAKHGDPNGEGLPEWPRYETESDMAMDLNPDSAAHSRYRAAKLDAWDLENAL